MVAPFWSNTQVLWYRKSFVEKAGLDMKQPVTWDQIIQAAADNGGTVGGPGQQVRGLLVWINALIAGAGGEIASETEKGATPRSTSPPRPARTPPVSSRSCRAPRPHPPTCRSPTRARPRPTFATDEGRLHGQLDLHPATAPATPRTSCKDLGWARYPETVEGEESRPPYGGIGIGVSEFSDEKEFAIEALECLTSPENQAINAELTGNMPSSEAGYDQPQVKELFPADLHRALPGEPRRRPRPARCRRTGATCPAASRAPGTRRRGSTDQTPEESRQFIEDVLQGRSLL